MIANQLVEIIASVQEGKVAQGAKALRGLPNIPSTCAQYKVMITVSLNQVATLEPVQ